MAVTSRSVYKRTIRTYLASTHFIRSVAKGEALEELGGSPVLEAEFPGDAYQGIARNGGHGCGDGGRG